MKICYAKHTTPAFFQEIESHWDLIASSLCSSSTSYDPEQIELNVHAAHWTENVINSVKR